MDARLNTAVGESETAPPEPLEASAPLAWREAPRLCYRDPETGKSCESYHRVWQYMRLLGLITSVRTNTDFLVRQFRAAARQGNYRRALVAGTADYSTLAHLTWAYQQEHTPLAVTVVDRCPTSILLNRWYADRYDVGLTTVCDDALSYVPDEPVDLVCTHNFIARFDAGLRAQLISRWYDTLRPGGLVITTQRVRPHELKDRVGDPPVEVARAFAERTVAIARRRPEAIEVDLDELAQAVFEYAMTKWSFVIRSSAEVASLFTGAGFDVELVDEGDRLEREHDRPSAIVPGKDQYRMRIVARRR